MAITKYEWSSLRPASPGLHMTCLSNEKYMTLRWWDGKEWWDIATSRGNKTQPFTWPRGALANGHRKPEWVKYYLEQGAKLYLRKINDQRKVRRGIAYKHYEPAEVLAWLVSQGLLNPNWKEAYQDAMRAEATR